MKLFSTTILLFVFMSNIAWANSDYDSEIAAQTIGLSYAEKLALLGDTIEQSQNNQRIIQYALHYGAITDSDTNKLNRATGVHNLGIAYWLVSDYDRALSYFYRSLEMAREIPDTLVQINSHIYLGLIYGRLIDREQQLNHYSAAYGLSHNYSDYYFAASACWNMGTYYNEIGNYRQAVVYLEEALSYLAKSKFKSEFAKNFAYGLVHYYFAEAHRQSGMLDSAYYYCEQSISENLKINNLNILAPVYILSSMILRDKNMYDESISACHTALKISHEIQCAEYRSWAYGQMAETFKKMNQYDSAFYYLQQKMACMDTINANDSRLLSAKLELKNKEQLHEKEMEWADRKLRDSLVIAGVVLISSLLISGLLFALYRLKKRNAIKLAAANATKDKFFTIISHDLNSPISSFFNLSSVLADYYDDMDDEEKLKHITSLRDSSGNVLKLLENLLTWSRIQIGGIKTSPESVDLSSIIAAEVDSKCAVAAAKGIEIGTEFGSELMAYADKEMMSTVIRNLLSNSIKFTRQGGNIRIKVTDRNDMLEVRVADDGVGIDDQNKAKIFKLDGKFSTLGTEYEKGTGLGLNLCKEFVERNGGNISFESESGKGSTFCFTVPKLPS